MARSLYTNPSQPKTHEGATRYNIQNPLIDLTFTKGSVLFQDGFYQTQQDELNGFIKALLAAENYESGFGWKYGAYARDPKKGKGNRIQGSVIPAILTAHYPEHTDYIEEYVFKCLQHRPDDVIAYVAHLENMGLIRLKDMPTIVKKSLAQTLASFDDYQLLKYSRTQVNRSELRKNGSVKSLRLVDVLGLCKNELDPRMKNIYSFLHQSTRKRNYNLWEIAEWQHVLFSTTEINNDAVNKGRPSVSQMLSTHKNTRNAWQALLNAHLLPDMALLLNIRNMIKAGFTLNELGTIIENRQFKGIWPHQIYAGYKAVVKGETKKKEGSNTSYPHYDEIFEIMLLKIVEDFLPPLRSLGFGDVSGSMSTFISKGSKTRLLDVAKVLCACIAATSGYAATFSDEGYIASIEGYKGPLDMVLNAPEMQKGYGSTQVYGAVIDTIKYIKQHHIPPFKVLYFFSDMQFHPPKGEGGPSFGGNRIPPLETAIQNYQANLNETPLIVLWNLSSYEGAPLSCEYPGVCMVSGYDTRTFQAVKEWINNGGRTISRSKVTGKDEQMAELLDYIRSF